MSSVLIECYPNSFASFNRTSAIEIHKIGNAFDKVMLEFTLPDLPQEFCYSTNCIYDLIRSLELEISGSSILYLGRNLKIVDMIERNFDELTEICSLKKINDRFKIFYPLDLNLFVNKFNKKSNNECHGIYLDQIYPSCIRIICKIGSILNIIEPTSFLAKDISGILKLQLDDYVARVNYHRYLPDNYIDFHNKKLHFQKISRWINSENECQSDTDTKIIKIFSESDMVLNKVVLFTDALFTDTLDLIKSVSIIVSTKKFVSLEDSTNITCQPTLINLINTQKYNLKDNIYASSFDIDVSAGETIYIFVSFNKTETDTFALHYSVKVTQNLIYLNGSVGLDGKIEFIN